MNGLARLPIGELVDGFDQLLEPLFRSSSSLNTTKFKCDAYETEGTWIVEAALPGVERDNISLDISDGLLEISVEFSGTREENAKYAVRELTYGKSCRLFSLPRGIDVDNPTAQLKDGILTLSFAKEKQNKIKIEVK